MNTKQKGTTLIELMISLVISVSLIATVGSLFLQMQKVNRAQSSINQISDDARYSLEILQKEIRRSGGLRNKLDNSGSSNVVFSDKNQVTFPGNIKIDLNLQEYIKGDVTDPPLTNDAFVIRYQLLNNEDLSSNGLSNNSSPCTANSLLDLGEDPSADIHVVNIYYFVDNQNNLMCTSKRFVNDACIAGNFGKNCNLSDTPVKLIENVQNLSVYYGVDTNVDGAANYYVQAPDVPVNPQNLWKNIVSARLYLVLKSENKHLAKKITPYLIEGATVTPTDHSFYRVFSTTIMLRNQLI